MGLLQTYTADVVWTGAGTTGTASYTAYSRDHEVHLGDKPPLLGSSDPAFRGDPTRFSPEELLVAALAQCHMLWFLHLASADGVVVTAYTDRATGTMRISGGGHGQFTDAVLRPLVTVVGGPPATDPRLAALHERAHQYCFISRSVSFPVRLDPADVLVAPTPAVAPEEVG